MGPESERRRGGGAAERPGAARSGRGALKEAPIFISGKKRSSSDGEKSGLLPYGEKSGLLPMGKKAAFSLLGEKKFALTYFQWLEYACTYFFLTFFFFLSQPYLPLRGKKVLLAQIFISHIFFSFSHNFISLSGEKRPCSHT